MPSTPKKIHWTVKTCIVLAILLVAAGLLLPSLANYRLPSIQVERETQRQTVLERIQTAGGWDALQKACVTLAQTNQESPFEWSRGRGNPGNLPLPIAALQPNEVWFYAHGQRYTSDQTDVPIVHIKIFGAHATGGHSQPYYGLEIISGPGGETYKPNPKPAASGNSHKEYRKITDTIYEIY